MKNLRKYGKPPFSIAVIHGGPGAAGEMAPVARELKSNWGVLEPFQTENSINGQVQELKTVLEENGVFPVILIGFSWGAWLSFIFAANYPAFLRKLILVGSGPFEEKYAVGIQKTRLNRLSQKDRKEAESLIRVLNDPAAEDKGKVFSRLGELFLRTDAYDPVTQESEAIDFRVDIFQRVWKEAEKLRRSGKLLQLGESIKCPVVAIHGDYDPHPAEGVQKPLSSVLKDFRFILLKNCGHNPWIEQKAREEFFRILREELVR
ncbi:MAG: alpha/beta hydrolase [candidate division Zixibacteria bacterium]|nr:alpha/beta hydrolase [candidate division Zixibacteria bacterium]